MRVGWCDVCIDFTNVIKVDVDVDVNEMSLLNVKHTQHSSTALHVVRIIIFVSGVFILLTKMRTETKIVPSTWYIFDVSRHVILTYLRNSFIPDNKIR